MDWDQLKYSWKGTENEHSDQVSSNLAQNHQWKCLKYWRRTDAGTLACGNSSRKLITNERTTYSNIHVTIFWHFYNKKSLWNMYASLMPIRYTHLKRESHTITCLHIMTNAVNRKTNRMAFNVNVASMKVKDSFIVMLLLIEGFELQWHCDFNVGRINPKINRNYILHLYVQPPY